MTPLRQRMLEDLQIRRYSPTTIRIYLHEVAEFAQHFGKPPDRFGAEHIRQYQLFLVKEKKVSRPTFIQVVCALRFLYNDTLNRKIPMERIPFPRRERKLPLILSREEVKALLEAPGNLRHRTLLAILYGCGLRVSEVTQLKVSDIDSARNVVRVRHGKGCEDRQTLLPAKLLELLRCYWRKQRPTDWLFPSTDSARPISPKAVFLACRKAAQRAGISKPRSRSGSQEISVFGLCPGAETPSTTPHTTLSRCPKRPRSALPPCFSPAQTAPSPAKPHSLPSSLVSLSSMNSIGSAHARPL